MRLSLIAAVTASLVCASASRADQVVCSADGAGTDTCDVFLPNVLDPITEYPTVQFMPGDKVTVTATGCVQTGGSGNTWKDYVNPKGPNSDHLYHGLIAIPGSTTGLVWLSKVNGAGLPSSTGGTLRLGYEDDAFGDNGYWSPDNGTDDQCANSAAGEAGHAGKARVHLVIKRANMPFPPASTYGQCITVDASLDRCRIDRPDVTQAEESYPSILFRPGDTVTISAGGCVQTGGGGRTWKRYVNPSGPDTDDVMDGSILIPGRYHGLISIPGVTNGLERLVKVVGKPNLPASTGGPLVLGYEDFFDGYRDNGYWRHDDGTEDQCQGVGPAFVTLDITHAATPVGGHVNLDALEITQSIQNVNQSVPLVSDKITFVRAYLTNALPAVPRVTGVLRATLSSGASVTVNAVAPVTVRGNETLRARRESLGRSLNFLLPTPVIAGGDVRFELLSLTDTATGSPIACNGCLSGRSVAFLASPVLRVTAIALTYTSPKGTFTPTVLDLQLLGSWLGRAYPTAAPEYGTRVVVANDTWPFDCDHANAQIGAIRANDMANGDNPRIHYYGMVSDGDGFMRGCANVPVVPTPSVVASGPTGLPATSGLPGIFSPGGVLLDTDGSYGDWYGGHEIGHTFGRNHPGFCSDNSLDDSNYPFPNGQISDDQGSYVGLDVGDFVQSLPPLALPGVTTFDVMTYCQPEWLSTYVYQGVRERLIDEDAAFRTDTHGGSPARGAAGAGGSTAGAAKAGGASASGADANVVAITAQGLVHIVALLDLTANTGKFQYVTPVASGVLPVKTSKNQAIIRALAANGRLVREYVAEYRLTTDRRPNEHRTATIDTTIQIDARVERLALFVGNRQLDEFHAVPAPPSTPRRVRIVTTAQVGGEPGATGRRAYWLTWDRVMKRPGDSITYTVEMDDGGLWRTIAIGTTTNRLRLTEDQAHKPRLRVTATNGFYNSERVVIGGI